MQSKLFAIGTPDLILIETQESGRALPASVSTDTGITDTNLRGTTITKLEDVEVSCCETQDKKLEVFIQADVSHVKYVKLRWQRRAAGKVQILGDAWERGYGDLQWMGLSSRRTMPWYFLAAADEKIYGYGVMVRPSSMCFWQMDTRGITLVLDVRCGGCGVKLNGRKLLAATVIAMETSAAEEMGAAAKAGTRARAGERTFRAAQDFCKFMCTDPLTLKKPVYGSNNWYYAYGVSSEGEILADTDYLIKLTEGAANPPYMVIDDGWQEYRRPDYIGGPWKKGNERFQDLKRLADQISEKGAIPGIWVRFLQNIDPQIPVAWRLERNREETGLLDPSVPEVLEYIKEDIRRISGQWGYKLIKHDFSTYDMFGRWGMEMKPFVTVDGWKFRDPTRTSAEIVKELYAAIYEAASETDTVIIGCNTIGHLGAGLMHVNRTGDDTSGLHWERTRQMGINTLAFRLPQHGAFYEVDADCVGITGKVPWFYNRQWADVIAESGTPLFVSAKPGVLDDEQNEQLHQIILKASAQDHHKIPLDWEYNDTPESWGEDGSDIIHYTWYRPEDDIPRSRDAKYCIQLPL